MNNIHNTAYREGRLSVNEYVHRVLEPIPKLAMNPNKLTPNNHSAGKLEQNHVVLSLFFIANQEFAKTIGSVNKESFHEKIK